MDDGLYHALQVVDGSDLDEKSNHGLRIISRGTAILLLFVYMAYLYFQVRTCRCFVVYPCGIDDGDVAQEPRLFVYQSRRKRRAS